MIPTRIQLHLHTTKKTECDDELVVLGELKCCEDDIFRVDVAGQLKKGIFSMPKLYPYHNTLGVFATCSKCNDRIVVFDASKDGYERASDPIDSSVSTTPFVCKCTCNRFRVQLKYEYSGLEDLLCENPTNANDCFSWIWVSLECADCNRKYTNLVDVET